MALSAYYTDPTTRDIRYLDFLADVEDHIRPLEKATGTLVFDGTRRSTGTQGAGEMSEKDESLVFSSTISGRSSKYVLRAAPQEAPEFRADSKAPNVEVLLERLKLQTLRERIRFHEFMRFETR